MCKTDVMKNKTMPREIIDAVCAAFIKIFCVNISTRFENTMY